MYPYLKVLPKLLTFQIKVMWCNQNNDVRADSGYSVSSNVR